MINKEVRALKDENLIFEYNFKVLNNELLYSVLIIESHKNSE